MKFTLHKNAIKAMMLTAAKNDVRHYLNGLHVMTCEAGTIVSSCDGHRGARYLADMEPKEFGDVIIPLDFCETLAKIKTSKYESANNFDFYVSDDGTITVRVFDNTMSVKAITGKFPDMARVIPEKVERSIGNINFEYARDAQKAIMLIDPSAPSKQEWVEIIIGSDQSMANSSDGRFTCVIMNMRHNDDAHSISAPIWARTKYHAPEAATAPATEITF